MSMSCSIYRLTESQTSSLLASPELVDELLGNPPLPPKVSFWSQLFGKASQEVPRRMPTIAPVAADDTLELHQAWHILHYLFSGSDAEGEWPSAFIMCGGQEIGPDLGYGPARLLSPTLTREVAQFLDAQTAQTLQAAYVAPAIEAARIYWQVSADVSQQRSQIEELWSLVADMQNFFQQSVRLRASALVQIF